MDNMQIYNEARVCPTNAQRTIQAGKLKGKTDINPMWRIKKLTEMFGACGVGWKTENETFWTTPSANGEVVAWCSLQLRYKGGDSCWSEPVFGIGGSMLVDTQRGNLSSNDDAYKMAYTDAISVACKALGFAADIYWEADRTKYSRDDQPDDAPPAPEPVRCSRCAERIIPINFKGELYTEEDIVKRSRETYHADLCWKCMKDLAAQKAQAGGQNENAG